MCRVLMYKGKPVRVDDLLYQPDNSLVLQTHSAQMLNMLNLAGFGMIAWDFSSHYPDLPFSYRSTNIPIFDRNLKELAEKLRVTALIAHVRGVPYHDRTTVGEQNLHPFHYKQYKLALAHNGDLAGFDRMRFALVAHIKPDIAAQIRGNTDTEWIYALLLSQFDDPRADVSGDEIAAAVERTLSIIRDVRTRHGISTSSPANLFISDGQNLVAVRYTFDYGCYDMENPAALRNANHAYLSLWYTTGTEYGLHDEEWKMIGGARNADSVIISSEPLTRDTSTWYEVPEYSILLATNDRGKQLIQSRNLSV